MKRLQLPVTIRTPKLDEAPDDPKIRTAILEAEKAKIVEGYTLHTNIPDDSLYRFYAEINIDNIRLWNLIKALLELLPEEVSLIYGPIDHEPLFSSYRNKSDILNIITEYKAELTQDGFLEFGFIYHDNITLQEIFIKKTKYIQYWGVDRESFDDVIKRFDLYEIEGLKFIDEYPLVTESLTSLNPKLQSTSYVLKAIEGKL